MKKEISRKQFLAIGFGAVGTAIASCSSGGGRGGSGGNAAGSDGNGGSSAGAGGGGDSKTGGTSGSKTGGTSGSKTGGTSGTGGSSGGTGGSGTGGTGTGGSKTGGAGGTASGGTGGTASGGTGGTSAANMCSAKIVAKISNNHNHALEIPMADITAGATKCYNAAGTAGHNHYVTVTAADFTTLKGGGVVKVFSCNGGDHEYVLSCVANFPAAAAPACPGGDANMTGSVACSA
jgi:hypothetical protein